MSDINKKLIKFIICFFIIICFIMIVPKTKVIAKNGASKIIMEVNSNRVLFEENAYEQKYMASTTKILTAIVIIENCNLDDIITITKKTTGIEGSSIYLEEGEKLSVKDLLYGLMLRSGNDCAETLAVHCSGNIKEFAELMNKTAKKIGALNSNFVNPHGLHDDNHYTTAYDLALISAYSIKNSIFKEIVSTKSIKIPFTTRDYDRFLINKNKMLSNFEGSTGIKTGYTKKAGRCLVTSCERNGIELVCVVLNCPPMFEESERLLTDSFSNYKLYKIIESDNIIDFIYSNGTNFAIHVKNDVILALTEKEFNSLKICYDYPNKTNYYLKSDQEIGLVKIYAQNNLLFEEKIYTI